MERSYDHCCSRKAISITYSECGSVALGIKHTKRIRHVVICGLSGCRSRLKSDDTRAETRFRLSAKRTSPFKSAGAPVQWTTGAEVCASAVVMLDAPCSEVV